MIRDTSPTAQRRMIAHNQAVTHARHQIVRFLVVLLVIAAFVAVSWGICAVTS